jgi:ribulose 1,5-bisphosphate synthetase/thiazole synthase
MTTKILPFTMRLSAPILIFVCICGIRNGSNTSSINRNLSAKGLHASLLSPRCTDIAIVGGGLAGLALAHNLLQKSGVHVTIYDKAGVGQGGASSVAGG